MTAAALLLLSAWKPKETVHLQRKNRIKNKERFKKIKAPTFSKLVQTV